GAECAPQVVDHEGGHTVAQAFAQPLDMYVALVALAGATKQKIATITAWNCPNNIERHFGQRQRMFATVLGSLLRQRDSSRVHINLAPAQAADLTASTSGENQQFNDLAKIIIAAGVPHLHKFGVTQSPVAGCV